MRHEWDWPEPEPIRSRERVVTLVPRRRGWSHPTVTRFCNAFFHVVVQSAVFVFAGAVALIGIGALWLLCAAMSA